MQRIYAAIRVALPASADPEELARPERAAEIGAALDALADNASLLQAHVGGEERQMQFLARSVARDARDVRRAWREGQHPRAAFLLRQITEDCVVCHTRLPSDDSPVAKFLARRGPGIHHLCFASSDVRGDDARLRAAGAELLRSEPTRGAGGCWVQFVHPKSAGGVLVELSEPGSELP